MSTTPLRHFDDDFGRAWAIHAAALTADEPLRSDLCRSAIAFGVGAVDAYLCDAFVDSLATAMKRSRQEGKALPDAYAKLELPIGPLLATYKERQNWGLRMAARAMMDRDNVLQITRVKGLFNPILPANQQLWKGPARAYIALDRKRLTGTRLAPYRAKSSTEQRVVEKAVSGHLRKRIGGIIQRRHDIVHNCDRPKSSPQRMKVGSARNMLRDLEDFVRVLDAHLDAHRTS